MPEYQIINSDCIEAMRAMPDNSVDSICTDPPYELGFMGKTWDNSGIAYNVDMWREALRVLKPGGHLLTFSGSRTYHRMAVAIEDAGFEIRDQIMWVYGCLDDQTEVATAKGVMPYHKTKVGDLVMCYDAAQGQYSYQPILEIVEYEYSDTAYRLVGDFGEQVVSRNHRCIVERGGIEVFEYAETLQREARVPVLEDLPALQRALHGVYEGTGNPQQDLQPGLFGGADRGSEHGGDAAGIPQGENDSLRGMLAPGLEAGRMAAQGGDVGVQPAMQRRAARGPVGNARAQGAGGLVGGGRGVAHGQDDGAGQSRLEGRGDVHQAQGAVREPGDQVRALPAGVPADGAQGRLRDGAPVAGGASDGPGAAAGRGGSPHQSRGDGQPAGESDVVRDERPTQGIRAWSGHKTAVVRIVPFHYTGKVWCLRVPTGAFVAVRNGVAFPTGNSGFPKSLDVSKAIDKAGGNPLAFCNFARAYAQAVETSGRTHSDMDKLLGVKSSSCYWAREDHRGGMPPRHHWKSIKQILSLGDSFDRLYDEAEREVIGVQKGAMSGWNTDGTTKFVDRDITVPATDAARQWEGWGTALKPAHEPICVARKPIQGTVAANVLAFGTGALNIDGCRVATDENLNGGAYAAAGGRAALDGDERVGAAQGMFQAGKTADSAYQQPTGRWPANIIHDGSDEVLALFPDVKSGGSGGVRVNAQGEGSTFQASDSIIPNNPMGASTGSAARFFKAIKTKEHEEAEFSNDFSKGDRFIYCAKASKADRGANTHPTVKPTDLMAYLVRLVTPPGGLVLDPFMGSGSTGKACMREGFRFIGCELSAEYVAIAEARIQHELYGDIL